MAFGTGLSDAGDGDRHAATPARRPRRSPTSPLHVAITLVAPALLVAGPRLLAFPATSGIYAALLLLAPATCLPVDRIVLVLIKHVRVLHVERRYRPRVIDVSMGG